MPGLAIHDDVLRNLIQVSPETWISPTIQWLGYLSTQVIALEWNVFISHASEDKETVARPLTKLLTNAGLKVWLDENELTLGDSLSRKIEEGLARSEYGVVILSKQFFKKRWPPHELAGLAAKQLIGGRKVILPVWHGVDQSFIVKYSPPLADTIAVSTGEGLDQVARDILHVVGSPASNDANQRPLAAPSPRKRAWWLVLGIIAVLITTLGIARLYLNRKPLVPLVDETDREWREDSNRALFQRYNHAPISGYFVVSCNTCGRPRAWAFYLSGREHGSPVSVPVLDSVTRHTTSWPSVEFLYPDDKPGISNCVEFPAGVCDKGYETHWSPRHGLIKPTPQEPALRLQLRLLVGGVELGVANESGVLAQGINVDGMAWQIGAPGAEYIKSFQVRDLGPFADTTIPAVFDEWNTGANKPKSTTPNADQ